MGREAQHRGQRKRITHFPGYELVLLCRRQRSLRLRAREPVRLQQDELFDPGHARQRVLAERGRGDRHFPPAAEPDSFAGACLLDRRPRPLIAEEDHAAAEGPRAPKLQTRARILVADDDRAILHVLDTVLSGDGYQVVTVEDGEAAVERARSDGFDLILLDIQMPRLDGLAAARKLRGEPRLAGVPIVMLTARNADRDIEAAFAEGVTDYITKPFAVAQMRARVRSWLARSADVER